MRLFGRDPKPSAALLAALDLPRSEKVLAFATDDNTGAVVVASTAQFALVDGETVLWRRPWLDVDTGQWNPDNWTLTVTWVGAGRGAQFTFKQQETRLPEVFHERVQASVVLAASLPTTGPGQSGRVVIRKNLRTGELSEQVLLGRRTQSSDPAVERAVAAVRADLRDQVGMPPAEH